MNLIFIDLVKRYFAMNPRVVERLAAYVIHGLIEHVAPSTAMDLVGEASASPVAGLPNVGYASMSVTSR